MTIGKTADNRPIIGMSLVYFDCCVIMLWGQSCLSTLQVFTAEIKKTGEGREGCAPRILSGPPVPNAKMQCTADL